MSVIAIVGVYLAFIIYNFIQVGPSSAQTDGYDIIHYSLGKTPQNVGQTVATPTPTPTPIVDTSKWKTYTDKKYNFSFQYDPSWKVIAPKTTNGFYVVQVDPGTKYYNIKVSVSPTGFFAMDGLQTTPETINGYMVQDDNGLLYGIKNNNTFYTFDIGWSLSLKPEFDALVHTVQFSNTQTAQ